VTAVIKKADAAGECQFCGMSAFDARQAEERLARLARVEILRARTLRPSGVLPVGRPWPRSRA
jgi:hypothetical protein